MLILHVTRDYAPAHCGGTSTAVLGLTRALNQKGLRDGLSRLSNGDRGRKQVVLP